MIEIPTDLQNAINRGECVAFIGSGLSSEFYPSWHDLIIKLCNECGVEFPTDTDIDADHYLKLADECQKQNLTKYHELLKNEFSKPITSCPEYYNNLIKIPFKSFITINFDPLLASRRYLKEGSKIFSYMKGMKRDDLEGNIFYIHGYVEEDGDVVENQLVLSQSDFNTAYDPYSESDLHEFLKPLFKFDNILFIGCGLNEPPLIKLLDIAERARKKHSKDIKKVLLPKSYILLAENDKPTTSSRYQDLGINVISYKKHESSYKHIELLRQLQQWSNIPKATAISPFSSGEPEI